MTETIATRVARIIAGTTHALMDKAERLAPDAMMAQSIREIDQVISEVRLNLGKAEAAKHLLMSQLAKLNAEHEKLAEHIQFAVEQQRDDLASAAIGRQTDIEDYLLVLKKSLDEQSERGQASESYLLALQAKKRELEQLLGDYLASTVAQTTEVASLNNTAQQVRVESAESTFNRMLSGQTGVAGLGLGASQDAASLKALADMQRSHRIAERLAALKANDHSK